MNRSVSPKAINGPSSGGETSGARGDDQCRAGIQEFLCAFGMVESIDAQIEHEVVCPEDGRLDARAGLQDPTGVGDASGSLDEHQ
jgi:hypothetical protein